MVSVIQIKCSCFNVLLWIPVLNKNIRKLSFFFISVTLIVLFLLLFF